MSRVAHREGYPEIGLYWEKVLMKKLSMQLNLLTYWVKCCRTPQRKSEVRVEAENGATAGKFDLAKRAKAANLDAIHDTVHEMAEMRLVTEKHLKDYLRDTLVKIYPNYKICKINKKSKRECSCNHL